MWWSHIYKSAAISASPAGRAAWHQNPFQRARVITCGSSAHTDTVQSMVLPRLTAYIPHRHSLTLDICTCMPYTVTVTVYGCMIDLTNACDIPGLIFCQHLHTWKSWTFLGGNPQDIFLTVRRHASDLLKTTINQAMPVAVYLSTWEIFKSARSTTII